MSKRNSLALRCIALGMLGAVLTSCGTAKLAAGNASGRTFAMTITGASVTPVNDYLGTGPRIVFSTAAARTRPDTVLQLTNPTDTTVNVNTVTSTSNAFVVDKPLLNGFSLAPQASIVIPVAFRPKSAGITQGSLSLAVAGGRTMNVALSGLNTKGIESGSEASLQAIFDALGYGTNAGMPAHPPKGIHATKADTLNSISMSNSAVGGETLTPLFTQADVTKPVNLIPAANYMGRSKSNMGWLGINAAGSNTQIQRVLAFSGGADIWGGENQQLLPGYGGGTYSGLVAGSSVSFEPKYATFGFVDQQHSVFSEDQLNYNGEHSIRIYPATTSAGSPIANTYLIGEDSIATNHYKNYDYQDFVFVLSNVKPAG